MSKYDEIINLPHHTSSHHKPMSMYDRAAQFASFDALSGLDEAIDETSRVTSEFVELSEDEQQELSRRLAYAMEYDTVITITYFQPDSFKEGGSYRMARGTVRKIDPYAAALILADGQSIPLSNIYSITSPAFG